MKSRAEVCVLSKETSSGLGFWCRSKTDRWRGWCRGTVTMPIIGDAQAWGQIRVLGRAMIAAHHWVTFNSNLLNSQWSTRSVCQLLTSIQNSCSPKSAVVTFGAGKWCAANLYMHCQVGSDTLYPLSHLERKLHVHWPVRTKTPYTLPVCGAKLYIHWGRSSENSIYIEPSLGHSGTSASAQKIRTVKRNDTGLQLSSQNDF